MNYKVIFKAISGSYLYGTSRPDSDLDIRGICLPPMEALLGLSPFEQHKVPDEDTVIYDLRKFCRLALNANPNILEMLFVPEDCILEIDRYGERLIENRYLFLSTKVVHTYSGYAFSQLKRIEGHRRWLLNPPIEPTLGMFGGILVEGQARFPNQQAKQDYKAALKEWKSYQTWIENRNPARAELERKYGFDCYTEDTDFLTADGWKNFDDITEDDKLATVYIGRNMIHRSFGRIEYQAYTERFEGIFTGNMHGIFGYHTNVLTTPNHRVLCQKEERRTKKKEGWSLNYEAAQLPDTFLIMRTIKPQLHPNTKQFFEGIPISPWMYLGLMGWYLADGTVSFSDRKIKNVRISQKKYGRLYLPMVRFQAHHGELARSSLYEYERKPNDGFREQPMIEVILSIRNKTLCERLVADCGYHKEKRIPRWAFGLSKRLMERLFDSMMLGDGKEATHGYGVIYYTSLEGLADDVQELAFLCGWETSLYGPYQNGMYHVFVNKNAQQSKRMIRSRNVKVVPVTRQRIVCFSVPNGTLITRRNGHISIHGNSKHASHLVRLLCQGEEILTAPDAFCARLTGEHLEMMHSVMAGEWRYEHLIDWAREAEQLLKELAEKSPLPKKPPFKQVEAMVMGMLKEYIREESRNE